MTERYTGPSAKRIADLLRHRVSFERGWFWTVTAICHGGKSDGLAFRQRPDGNGIDVHCHTGGCSARRGDSRTLRRSSGCPSGRPTNRCATRRSQGPREAALVEATAGLGADGGRPGRGGAAYHRRRGALRPEPRRAGHRGAAAPAVHASASR